LNLRRTSETKPKRKQQPGRRRQKFVLLLAALLLLGIAKFVYSLAISVSERRRTPGALIADYPERYAGLMHNSFTRRSLEILGPDILHQEILPELNARLFLFKWRESSEYHTDLCINAIVVAEAQDIFGGWFTKKDSGPRCGSELAISAPPGASYWKAQSGEFPRYYALVYGPAYHRAYWVEFVFADGSVSRSKTHGIAYALVIRRDEPIQIRRVLFLDRNGDSFASYSLAQLWEFNSPFAIDRGE